jgi:hypothetical protein
MRSGKETVMPRVELLLPFLLALFLEGAIAVTNDSGSGMDPNGRPQATTGDLGSIMDPNG